MKKILAAMAVASIGLVALTGCSEADTAAPGDKPAAAAKSGKAEKKEEKKEEKVPTEYKSALKSAETYSDMMHMSKDALYDQLVSEHGGKFSKKAGQYAIDNIDADWNKNALESAKTYQDTMAMSPEAIRDQLTSNYGGKFTKAQADYAIKNLD